MRTGFQIWVVFKMNFEMFVQSVEIIFVSSLLLFLSPSALPLHGFSSFSEDG